MGLFDGLLSKVSSYIPDEYEDEVMGAAQDYLPQAKEAGSGMLSSIGDSISGMFSGSNPTNGRMSDAEYANWKAAGNQDSQPGFWSNLFTDDPNSGWYDTMNQVPDNEKYSSKAEMEAAKAAQAAAPSKSIFSSIGDYFTDDPNSGWYDNMQKEAADQALVKQTMAGLAPQVQQQSVTGNTNSALEAAYKKALAGLGGTAAAAAGGAAASGLGSLGLTGALGALAPVAGAGVGYLASSGLRDQSQSAYNNMLNAAGTNVSVGPSASENLVDSNQDLANRAMATNQIAQRAQMGLTPEDIAMFQKARQDADASYQANQSKIQTDMNRRGMGMSPALLLAQQQQAAQDTARRQNDAQLAQTTQSFQAKQAAAQSLGNMANTNLQNDFSRGLAKANNQDAISRFNAEQQRAKANALVNANSTQGQQLGNAAAAKATSIGNIGTAVGTAVGALNK